MNFFQRLIFALRSLLKAASARPLVAIGAALAVVLILAVPWLMQRENRDDILRAAVETVLDKQDKALVEPAKPDVARRLLTVLIPYDRTRFFIHKGEPRGFEYDLVQQFEKFFNDNRAEDSEPLQTIFVPVPFAQLVDLLANGRGDIAAGGLTVTPERAARVEFSASYMDGVRELVVANSTAEIGNDLASLAGRRMVVVRGSSYVSHLHQVNLNMAAQGLDPITIVEAPISIMSEDLLELVHAGAISMTVVDEHIAQLWQSVLDGLLVTEIAIAEGNEVAWALSPDLDPSIKDAINQFLTDAKRGTMLGNVLFNRYFQDTDWIRNPLGPEAISEVSRYRPLFSKYADEFGLDWKLIAAVAFQESGFDPAAESAAGAVGLMQVLPSTAEEVGVTDLSTPDNQIAAGTRYLASLLKNFRAEDIEEFEAINLALAAYNAGPARLARLRTSTADELNLNPNAWFFNVERAAARDVGLETVRYVANVNKYRLAYELGETILSARALDKPSIE